jgi:hypothetical protein
MIPESHENHSIDLYRSSIFPYKWEYEMTLMKDVTAVDSVIYHFNGKWWLFTSIGNASMPINKNLSLFYSDDFPSDKWTAHKKNPIYADLRNSRMAGAVFQDKKDGNICRPAQNCLKDYGKETNINEIAELSPDTYSERLIKTIKPERKFQAVCTHTVNFSEHYMLRDIKTRKLRFGAK